MNISSTLLFTVKQVMYTWTVNVNVLAIAHNLNQWHTTIDMCDTFMKNKHSVCIGVVCRVPKSTPRGSENRR